jgi:hypothetical protein
LPRVAFGHLPTGCKRSPQPGSLDAKNLPIYPCLRRSQLLTRHSPPRPSESLFLFLLRFISCPLFFLLDYLLDESLKALNLLSSLQFTIFCSGDFLRNSCTQASDFIVPFCFPSIPHRLALERSSFCSGHFSRNPCTRK